MKSGRQRELAVRDRWQIIGGWLQHARTTAGLGHRELVEQLPEPMTTRRLVVLEAGTSGATEAELDNLIACLGASREDLDAHVQTELLNLISGQTTAVALPTIVVDSTQRPEISPDDKILTLVRLYGDPEVADGEVSLSGLAIESIAQRCGVTALECWQILARYIRSDRAVEQSQGR